MAQTVGVKETGTQPLAAALTLHPRASVVESEREAPIATPPSTRSWYGMWGRY